MSELTQLMIYSLLLKASVLHIESCFGHVILIASQAVLEENPASLLKALLFLSL